MNNLRRKIAISLLETTEKLFDRLARAAYARGTGKLRRESNLKLTTDALIHNDQMLNAFLDAGVEIAELATE